MSGPSRQEVKALLTTLLPAGSEQLYDLSESAYIGGTISGLAGALKDTLTDRIAALRNEANPSTVAELLPEWEQACGLTYTPIARFGTLGQRRNAVLAALRMSGGSFSLDDIRSIVQPYFLYANPADIQILEVNRFALQAANLYSDLVPVTVPAGPTGTMQVSVADAPRVGAAGVTAYVRLTTTRLDGAEFGIEGPSGYFRGYGAGWLAPNPTSVTNQLCALFAPQFAKKPIAGPWTLSFRNLLAPITVSAFILFAEAEGAIFDLSGSRLGDGKGSAIYNFAVVADPAKLGAGYDVEAAQRAITRWKPAHVNGFVALISPLTGTVCAIPDTSNAIPDRCIPC